MNFLVRGINSLFFPNNCVACKTALLTNETLICLPCLEKLPYTNNYLEKDNVVEQKFWGRLQIIKGYSFLYFSKKGRVQQLMHEFKYNGKKEVGLLMGHLYGDLLSKASCSDSVDLILPTPIHRLKKLKRGYNQSDYFAQGLSESMNIPWSNKMIKKIIHTESQTHKTRYERWKNVAATFKIIQADKLKNKHILLVDDVLTTGSTLEACGNELLKIKGLSISIATIAVVL